MSVEHDTINLQTAVRFFMRGILDAIQGDPHQWSERPCATCRLVSQQIGSPFGCYLYAQQRHAARTASGGAS